MILDLLASEGGVSIRTLSDALGVSEVTVRRDLDRLHITGQLQRTRGGAVARVAARESSYAEKLGQATAEKRAIAHEAAEQVRDGDVVAIGPGTTTEWLAHELTARERLTIVTNSLLVAQIFTESPQNQVILTGGMLRPATRAIVGDATTSALRAVRAGVAFLSGNGLLAEFGLSTPDMTVAEADRALAASADRVVALVDHTKLGVRAAIQTVAPEGISRVITDHGSPMDEIERLRDAGIPVTIAASAGL